MKLSNPTNSKVCITIGGVEHCVEPKSKSAELSEAKARHWKKTHGFLEVASEAKAEPKKEEPKEEKPEAEEPKEEKPKKRGRRKSKE